MSEQYRAARRDEIIAAAVRCIQRTGYSGTSMADIIAETGLSTGAIYGHFAGKREIFLAVAEHVLDARQADLSAARIDGSPLSPGALMRVLVDGLRREAVGSVIPQIWAEAAVDPDIREIASRIFRRVRALIEPELAAWAAAVPGRVDGDPSAWAHRVTPVVLGAAPGFLVQRAVFDGFDEEAYLDGLIEAFTH